MKTVTVAEAQANLPDLLRVVEAGEEIKLTRKKKAVAKIVPMNGKGKKVDWSDHFAKLDAIFGGRPARGKPGSQIVIDGRR
jgi:antitoxin (DNA-binding transcriptional repressor) of toxin-antitoxin stability system